MMRLIPSRPSAVGYALGTALYACALVAAFSAAGDAQQMRPLTAGSYSRMGANVRHYVMAKGETTFQVHGIGPFMITYVNPNDDPRKKK